jgi:hypothetical protein
MAVEGEAVAAGAQVDVHRHLDGPRLSGSTLTACGVQILNQGRDLGIVQVLPDDGALKMNAFE